MSEVTGNRHTGRPRVKWKNRVKKYSRERSAVKEVSVTICSNQSLWRFCMRHPIVQQVKDYEILTVLTTNIYLPIDMSWCQKVETTWCVINIKQWLRQITNLKAILSQIVFLKSLKSSIWEVTLWVEVSADFCHIEVLKEINLISVIIIFSDTMLLYQTSTNYPFLQYGETTFLQKKKWGGGLQQKQLCSFTWGWSWFLYHGITTASSYKPRWNWNFFLAASRGGTGLGSPSNWIFWTNSQSMLSYLSTVKTEVFYVRIYMPSTKQLCCNTTGISNLKWGSEYIVKKCLKH